MTNEEHKLENCPFCGGTDAMALPRTCDKRTPYNPSDRAFPVVRCNGCGAEAPGENWGPVATAITAWNRRAHLQQRPLTGREAAEARFPKTYCSQCGGEFGPGDQGYSNCEDHEAPPCETCNGVGTIDERLGGYSFSNPAATCPDCDGTGEGPAAAFAPSLPVREEPTPPLHKNHLPDLRYALDALRLAREAIEPLTEAQIKLHRIKPDTDERIEAAIVGMRYIIKRTEEAAASPSTDKEGAAPKDGVLGTFEGGGGQGKEPVCAKTSMPMCDACKQVGRCVLEPIYSTRGVDLPDGAKR